MAGLWGAIGIDFFDRNLFFDVLRLDFERFKCKLIEKPLDNALKANKSPNRPT